LAIARCSAVKSSGVNTSGGASSKKEPPDGLDIQMENVIKPFKSGCYA
jgi:hypothetical protein